MLYYLRVERRRNLDNKFSLKKLGILIVILFEKNIAISDKQTHTNIKIPFEINQHSNSLMIYFSYGPAYSDDYTAQKQVEGALKRYLPEESDNESKNVMNYLPIENFVTVSLSYENQYLGAYHNKAKTQTILINPINPSPGFNACAIAPGSWELQLNCHCIASKLVEVEVRIEVLND